MTAKVQSPEDKQDKAFQVKTNMIASHEPQEDEQEDETDQIHTIVMTVKVQSHHELEDDHQRNRNRSVDSQIEMAMTPHPLHPLISAALMTMKKKRRKPNGKNGEQLVSPE